MFSSGPSKSGSYRPYAIQSMVGKTSMKALAAKAAAKVLSEQPKEPKSLVEPLEKPQTKSDDDIIMVDSEEEDVLDECSPPRSSRSSSRRRPHPDVEFLDDSVELSGEKTKLPASKKKKRLTKAEKTAQAAKMAANAASQKTRAALLAALENANEDDGVVFQPESADSVRESSKEQIFVLWGNKKYKFFLAKNEKMREIFEKMAEKMKTNSQKVLIFCNSDPTHTLSPLDSLEDVGQERIFLSAPKDSPLGVASDDDVIPENFQIFFKIQIENSKIRTKIATDKRDTLRAFMEKFCHVMGKSFGDFVFSFDGDRLDPNERPETYQLEGDEVIDAKPV